MAPEVDDFLAHYGVPGMKWGRRKAAAVKRNSQLNSASKKKDARDRVASIETARLVTGKGVANARLKDAKKQYKSDKVEIGSREAKKILNMTKGQVANDRALAQQPKNGKELAAQLLIGVGAKLLTQQVEGALRTHQNR